MTNSNRKGAMPRQLPGPQAVRGIAIGIILTAVAVVVALGIAMTFSMRNSVAVSETNSQALLATTILTQAATLKSAIILAQAKSGASMESQHLNTNSFTYTTSGVGVYNPVDGADDPVTPPSGSITSSSTGWRWFGDGYTAALTFPGSDGYYHYPITLSYLQQGVCAQINKSLTGSANIPVLTRSLDLQTITGWIDLSADSNSNAISGYFEICFQDNRGVYQYFKVVQDDTA